MPMPALPGAHLILIETDLALAFFEALLDAPTGASDARQGRKRGGWRRVRKVVGQLVGRRERSAGQQKELFPRQPLPRNHDSLRGPGVEPRTLFAGAHGDALPLLDRPTQN